MSQKPIIPRVDEIVGPGIDALVALRPRALAKLNYGAGRYAQVFAGWRAQVALLLKRLADETRSARLPTADGLGLLELAADEYETQAVTDATAAIGTVTLTRGGGMPAGNIRKGTRFRRDALDTAIPRVRAATYEASADVVYQTGVASITVPIVAQKAGTHANAPVIAGSVLGAMTVADVLFDPLITVQSYSVAGGSDGVDEVAVRAQAGAYARGQYAPTDDAILASALRGQGVKRAAVKDVARILVTLGVGGQPNVYANAAFTAVNIADASWAHSAEWTSRVAQKIKDEAMGFGGAVVVNGVSNTLIRVEATVTLRDSKSLSYTRDIDAAIQAAITSYFDDRPDWWTFKLAQLRAVISRADRRILTCTLAAVKDLAAGTVIPEPAAPVASNTGFLLTHYMLSDSSLTTTYLAPT